MSISKLVKSFAAWSAVLGLLLSGLVLGGCATSDPPSGAFADMPGAAGGSGATNTPAPTPALAVNGGDTLHIGDPLVITFTDCPNPPPAFTVRIGEDGTITLIWNQTFIASGKGRGELEREIRARYVPSIYRDLTVTIIQAERWYFVRGEVKSPNRYAYPGPTSVLKAIAAAGDFTEFASKTTVQLTRADGSKTTVNCLKAQKDPRLDPSIYPGDSIFVKRRIW
jgi:polysaccharide export outer membrane protein